MAQPINRHYPGTPGTPLYVGIAPPGAVLTTRTLQNTSASAQASGFVSLMFGVPLIQGHVPAGQYPEFRLGDTKVAATIYNTGAWADGSMNMCGAFVRVPSGVAGSGTLSLNVCTGGTAPVASSRTLAEVVAGSDIKIEFTGTANLTGVWTASLNDAIANDANITLIGDGAAGKVWRVGGHFKQSAAAHGQLYCWHYIAVLQNEAGGLLGVRYLGVWGQIFGDVASPAPLHRIGTMVLKDGATTVRTMQGLEVRPSPSTEPGTPGTSISIAHFARAGTTGPDAKWDYFQCGGTGASDCTVRVVPDTAYVQKTKLVPPYGTALAVTDTPAVDYFVNGKGNHAEYLMGGTGEIVEIGVMPAWCAAYWINPSAANERAVRVNAMCALGYLGDVRPASSKKPAARNSVASGSFTGIENKRDWSLSQREGGIINPAAQNNVWGTNVSHRPSPVYSAYLMSGEPQMLDTMIGHACGHIMLTATGGYRNWRAARPLTTGAMNEWMGSQHFRVDDAGEIYDCAGVLMAGGGIRQGAWAFRDIAAAYAMVPASYPDGDYKGYLNYIIDTAFRGFNAYTGAHPSTYQNDGVFAYSDRDLAGGDGLFMVNYFDMMLCFASAVTENARLTTARQYLGRRFNAVASKYNTACFACYDILVWTDGPLVDSYADVVWKMSAETASLTFNTGTNRVTVGNASAPFSNWSPTNGDAFCFMGNGASNPLTRPYDEIVDFKRFYVVNASGKTFQLSATRGGAPLTMARDYSMTNGVYYANLQDRVIGLEFSGTGAAMGYLAASTGAMNYHNALGDDVSLARTELQAHLAYEGVDFTGNPKYAFQDTYPA